MDRVATYHLKMTSEKGYVHMANDCDFSIKIKGARKDREEFIRKMNDYGEENHFWRIFDCYVYEETDEYSLIGGSCAWSLETCCRASGYSEGIDLFEVNTKNLEMEAYSSEPGIGFEEHFIYKNGECIAEECRDMCEYWCEDFASFEEFKQEYNLPEDLTEDDLIEGMFYRDGGFGEWEWHI